jgi:hypothetical protein
MLAFVKNLLYDVLMVENASFGKLFLSLLTAIYDTYLLIWEKEGAVPAIKDPMLGNNVAKLQKPEQGAQ